MSSIKRSDSPCWHDSSDDEADFINSPARKIPKVENECENDAALARALEIPKEEEQTVHPDRVEHREEKKIANDDSKIKNVDKDDEDTDAALWEFDREGTYAICCTNCICPDNRVSKYLDVISNCGNSGDSGGFGNTKLYHRGCCHVPSRKTKFKLEYGENYLSPMQIAIDTSIDELCNPRKEEEAKPLSHLHQKYKQARRNETMYHNMEGAPATDSVLNTNVDYNENRKKFEERKGTRTKPLRVLDLFAGIGSGSVILKKLRIPLEKVVHVEHDPVAVQVSKYNHQDDGIDHVYITTFEEIYGEDNEGDAVKIGKLIRDHGPFELILSAAPCKNYSQVNAYRNKDDYNAQYLLKAGKIIKKINAIQKEKNDYGEALFLSENVVFRGKDNLEPICQCYGNTKHGLCPIDLDASDFSPCRRRRFYWTNIPLGKTDHIKEIAAHLAVPDTFLDEGFMTVARVDGSESEKDCMVLKANTFMATTSKIDDERMLKVKKKDDKYIMGTYSVREREIMIGLPEGYVQKAMENLFERLTSGGFQKPETEFRARYKSCLHPDLLHFAKECRFRVKTKSSYPYFQLEVSDPLEGRKAYSFYDEEGYSKHLIGNGWSIPVVEHLLEPLRGMFQDDSFLQTYKPYDYDFPWEPYIRNEKAEPIQEAEI